MKKQFKLILCFMFISLSFSLKAQVDTSTTQKLLEYIFQPIDKNQVPTGFLEEYGCPMLPPATFNGTLTDSNRIDMNLWRTLYLQLQTGWTRTTTNPLPTIISVNTTIKQNSGALPVPIPLLIGQYDVVKSNAFSSNLLSYNSGTKKIYDVPGRSQSPYDTKNLFAACPNKKHTVTGIDTFIVRSGMVWNNTGKTINQVQVNFSNGQGLQTVSLDTPIPVTYTDTGHKRWTIKVTLSDNSILQCYSDYYVLRTATMTSRFDISDVVFPFWGFVAPVNGVHSGAIVRVNFSNNNFSGTLRKPLIVVEGYDVSAIAPNLQDNYTVRDLIAALNEPTAAGYDFNNQLDDIAGYDLVFIDFIDGADDIVRNAAVVQEVINRVNTNKVLDNRFGNIRQQNVVMGISMGGLCARYALADMTKNFPGTPTETRLLITHDAPHRGANVPLGLQYMIRMMGGFELFNINVFDIFPDYNEAIGLLDAPATQQLLLYRAATTNTFATNTFLDATYRPMITFAPTDPQPSYRFIATANGNECAHPLFNPGKTFINLGAGISAGIYGRLLFFRVPIVSYKLATEVEAYALPNPGSTNKIARVYAINNLKLFGFIDIIRQLYNNTAYAPGNHLAIDGVPGSYNALLDVEALNEITNLPVFAVNLYISFPIGRFLGGYFGIYAYNAGVSINFTFVPVASALDVTPYNNTALSQSYVNGTNQVFPSSSETFIAQETVQNSPLVTNNEHMRFTARNSRFLFNEMENQNNSENCSNECYNPYYISGPDVVCSDGTYFIPGLPRGAGVTWGVSPSYIATPSCSSCLSPTLTKQADGKVTLTATVTNSCASGTIQLQKEVTVGAPVIEFVSFLNDPGGEGYWCSTHYNNTFTVYPDLQAVYEARLLSWPSMTLFRTNNWAVAGTDPFGYVPSGWYVFGIRTVNECGMSNWYETEVEYVDCMNLRMGSENFTVVASPNPTDGNLTVTISQESAEVKALSKSQKVVYQLYNFNRTSLVKLWTFDNSQNRQSLDVHGLKSGQYVLVVTKGKYRQSTQIMIK